MATYSITPGTITAYAANTGYPPTNPQLPLNHQIEDAYATPGGKQFAMSTGTQVQAKRLDGHLRYYTIDASRSDPSKNLIFLLPV